MGGLKTRGRYSLTLGRSSCPSLHFGQILRHAELAKEAPSTTSEVIFLNKAESPLFECSSGARDAPVYES